MIKSRNCFRHSPHLHIGNSEPDSRHQLFGQLFWFSGKCVFRARGKQRGFSPGAAARHSHSARAIWILAYFLFFHQNFRLSLLCSGSTQCVCELGNKIDTESDGREIMRKYLKKKMKNEKKKIEKKKEKNTKINSLDSAVVQRCRRGITTKL